MDRPLIFLHLPKTAGTTFNSVLLRHFHPSEVHLLRSSDPDAVERFTSMPQPDRHRIRLLRGHQVFGLHEHLAPGARYLTLVRHPVDRLVSHFEFVTATEHPLFIDAIRERRMTLHDYVTSGISGELENGQTRWLAGVADDRELTDGDLEQALINLEERFLWVGLVERFAESLVELARRVRWLRVDYRTRNVGTRPAERAVAPATRAAILERNRLDVELHTWVQRRFDGHGGAYLAARRAAAAVLRGLSTRSQPSRRIAA